MLYESVITRQKWCISSFVKHTSIKYQTKRAKDWCFVYAFIYVSVKQKNSTVWNGRCKFELFQGWRWVCDVCFLLTHFSLAQTRLFQRVIILEEANVHKKLNGYNVAFCYCCAPLFCTCFLADNKMGVPVSVSANEKCCLYGGTCAFWGCYTENIVAYFCVL